jgi:hypothetical protein
MPRIQMTRSVKVALYFLRIYLIVLLALIGLKFWRTFNSPAADKDADPERPAATAPAEP